MTSRALAAAVLTCGAVLAACGPGAAEKNAMSAKDAPSIADEELHGPVTVDSPREPEAVPAGSLARASVERTVGAGLGTFLQHVVLSDDPVMVDGKFHGFRIRELRGAIWKDVDLRPDDVVTRVNGFPIERPEQAVEAFHSLSVASELRVAYERDGAPRELRYAIVDPTPPAGPARAAAKTDGGPASAPSPSSASTPGPSHGTKLPH